MPGFSDPITYYYNYYETCALYHNIPSSCMVLMVHVVKGRHHSVHIRDQDHSSKTLYMPEPDVQNIAICQPFFLSSFLGWLKTASTSHLSLKINPFHFVARSAVAR